MVNRRRIEEVYNDYAKKVIPQDAGAVQRRECRPAFFAGVFNRIVAKRFLEASGA